MDDRSFWLSIGILGASLVVVLLDAASAEFDTPPGFWTVLGALAGATGARALFRNRGKDVNGET